MHIHNVDYIGDQILLMYQLLKAQCKEYTIQGAAILMTHN